MQTIRKTSAAQFREQLDAAPLRKLTLRERREKYGPVEFFPDDEIPFGLGRGTDFMPKLPEDEARALDGMLERHGVAKILRTLRELCDARTGHDGDGLESFEAIPESEGWQRQGDELEQLLLKLSRMVER